MTVDDGLGGLLPPLASWFRGRFGGPTPAQRLGWPAIAAGQHTLIFAPTGNGKTLAAFLACLDHLWRVPRSAPGVRILYLSPLKALNQDISRNLQIPLAEIRAQSEADGSPLPPLSVAVRSGDTAAVERQRMVRKPPDILITTPESLHLLLTSRARETLRSVSHVIVDEIHALCPNKRGVFLSLLLERLEAINPVGFVRIGLSATQRPLDEVARYLGGYRRRGGPPTALAFEPRPVTIVDAGNRKDLDLEVLSPFAAGDPVKAGSTWPAIESLLHALIHSHRSTIVFANNRRVVERLTANLNDLEGERGDAPAPLEEFPLARSHHGSLSQEERRSTEERLKAGDLPAVISTASLELGIDMGAVDLVCQVESPGSIARGIQRVGRAGHLVGGVSRAKLIAKTTGDLLETAALCRAMLRGEIESLRAPGGCLDVLAQQVVACVAMDPWEVPALFDMVRGASSYRHLTAAAFEGVLRMISGRFPLETFRDLRARVTWDRVHNRLHPLPGTSRLALTGGGTIPDTGQYPVYLGDGGPRLGELDEEFVLERRVGEAFVLGTSTWRIEAIEPHRVVVARAEGQAAVLPFWRGEDSPRTPELGVAVGALTREVATRLDDPAIGPWLRDDCRLAPDAARRLRDHIARQLRVAGAAPDDRTVLIESFPDPAGETCLGVLTPFGGKLHLALKLALQARLRTRLGIQVACLHGDDGILIRLPQSDSIPFDLLEGLGPETAESLIREELGESALFGLRFRQNAGRALLLPRPDPSKRAPLWLQRLRARDLLQVVRGFPDFPIVVETYRECLDDDLDLPRLRSFLAGIESGAIRVVTRCGESPSPFANDLVFRFTAEFLYQWDEPGGTRARAASAAVDSDRLEPLLDRRGEGAWLDPGAISEVDGRLRGAGHPPRTVDEVAEWLRTFGDLTADELAGPTLAFLVELGAQGRARTIDFPGSPLPSRWVGAEEFPLYQAAFAADPDPRALETIVRRYLETHALIGIDDLLARYPIDPGQATDLLERWADAGRAVRVDASAGGGATRWADRRNLADVRRLTIALRRRESVAVRPEVFADFVAHRQRVLPFAEGAGPAAVESALESLSGYAAPMELWESELLPRRIPGYRPSWLDDRLAAGDWLWRGDSRGRAGPLVAFVARDFEGGWPGPAEPEPPTDDDRAVEAQLRTRGASFAIDLIRDLGVEPSRVRAALETLWRGGRITNDRLEPLREGAGAMAGALAEARASAADGRRHRIGRRGPRRSATPRPEGRWSLLAPRPASDEASAMAWASVLLERYGVLTRETAAIDPWAPPWRDLAPWLARAELRGELRRGYYVEGLSGVQYATGEAAAALATFAARRPDDAPVLLSSLDPANCYGSGAPFDIDLLEGGTARLPRSPSNYLICRRGRPVLILEGAGKRLTGLASASEDDLRAAFSLVPSLAGPSRRVLKVESYNTAPALTSPAAAWLADAGFVRDFPGMAFYAGW